MPYVNESKNESSTKRAFSIYTFNPPPTTYFDTQWVDSGIVASQYGWRSHGEEAAARRNLQAVQSNAKWKDTAKVIAAMERIERATSNPIIRSQSGWDVHERTYSVQEYSQRVSPTQEITQGGKQVMIFTPSFTLGFTPNSAVRTDSFIRTQGGELLRQSRPTSPHASLAQWVGELRDFGSLFRAADLSSLKGQSRAIGSGYLSWQFALVPFFGDLQQAAQAILDSGPILRQFLLESNKIQHRSRKRILTQDALSVSGSNVGNNANNGQNEQPSSSSTPYGTINYSFRKACGYNAIRSTYKTTLTVTEWIKSFAKFEYFAFDPDGFLERITSYEQKARHLLGLSLTPDVVWELTPWSWMVDWFFDIGGFLSYQVSVESDSLVCRQSGSVYERTYDLVMHPLVYASNSQQVSFLSKTPTAWNPMLTVRHQRRLPGSPYDMGIDWSGFSTQRWFILGALGMTKGPGIKWH